MRRLLLLLLLISPLAWLTSCKSSEVVTDPAPPTRLPEFSQVAPADASDASALRDDRRASLRDASGVALVD